MKPPALDAPAAVAAALEAVRGGPAPDADAAAREAVGATLRLMVAALRSAPDMAHARAVALCDALEGLAEADRAALHGGLRRGLAAHREVVALTESGIAPDHGFMAELQVRVGRRLLPELDDPDDLRTAIRRVFDARGDHVWVRAIAFDTWRRLLRALGLATETVWGVPAELSAALRIIAHRIASLGLSPYITARMPELDELDSPFLLISERVVRYTDRFAAQEVRPSDAAELDVVLGTLDQCRQAVQQLRARKHVYGTSLRLTTLSRRLLEQIERLALLLKLTGPLSRDVEGAAVQLVLDLVEAETTRDHLGRHVRSSADLLAYQVVEHAARKGEKYIANTRREYWGFLLSSMAGGAFVAVFALLKLLIDDVGLPLGVEALLYGLNYAVCFVLIAVSGATLATKQPALTANAIARTLDGPRGSHDLTALADLIVRVWRSQFISFVGNLVCAFPLAIALGELYALATGAPLIGEPKATKLVGSVHPLLSGALFYAGVAGVFLFLAGLVGGQFDNRNLYRGYSRRIARHPRLVRLAGERRAAALAAFVDKRGGQMLGNVFLGFCLGATGTVGLLLGLPIDIRHIAFSSAHLGVGLDTLGYALPAAEIAVAALGVVLIGFVNFVVSFSLALGMAAESRRLDGVEYAGLAGLLLRRLVRRPLAWFYPPRADAPPGPAG